MFKRSSANYSLWPEQARPRRGMSFSLAAGGFAVGIIVAIAAANVASDFVRPVAMEPEPVENSAPVRPIPVYSATSTGAVAKASGASEGETAQGRAVRSAAKVALPTIGRAVPVVSETDGRGGDSATKVPSVRLTSDAGTSTTKADADVKLIRNETQVLREDTAASRDQAKVAAHVTEPQAAPKPEIAEPAAASQEQAKPVARAKRKAVRKHKTRRHDYANSERRYERPRPSYAARYRAGPVYGSNGAPVYGYFPY